ncbi:MAG: ribonuclease R [bacterium]
MKRIEIEEKVIELFYNDKDTLKLNYIAKKLNIKSEEESYFLLRDVLHDLIDRQVIERLPRRKYILKDWNNPSLLIGYYQVIDSTHSVETDNPKFPRIFIKKAHLKNALPGDKVKVQVFPQISEDNRKLKGEIIEVLERANNNIVGMIEHDGTFYFLVPDDPIYHVDFLIPAESLNGAKSGDKVSASLLSWTDPNKNPKATVKEIMGRAGVSEVEYDSILVEFDLNPNFPEEVIEQVQAYKKPSNRPIKARMDLRDKLIVTIDPYDAKDFDDALSLDIMPNGNYHLGVHIADVSHYVEEDTPLDVEARKRGNSTYLVDRVVPMLPEVLSNEICSLKPDEVRFCMSVFMEITPIGEVINYQITDSIICSKRRYNYDEVLEVINGKEDVNSELLLNLNELAGLLRKKRNSLGSIDFDSVEYKFVLDERKQPVSAYAKRSNLATSLVEECMLLCNKTVCNFIIAKSKEQDIKIGLPFVYRVHDVPEPKKLKEALNFLEYLADKKINKTVVSSTALNIILSQFKDTENWEIANSVLIRSMAKAEYSVNNIGHYGLAFDDYTHFTSPIRRYPDLIVHRLIKKYQSQSYKISKINTDKLILKGITKHCTETERVAMQAERASTKYSFTVMASRQVGEIFDGKVTGITRYGLYVQLNDIFCEGLLHIKDMWDDYYFYDEVKLQMYGKRNKKVFTYGTKIKVKIVKVNVDKREIDLELVKG